MVTHFWKKMIPASILGGRGSNFHWLRQPPTPIAAATGNGSGSHTGYKERIIFTFLLLPVVTKMPNLRPLDRMELYSDTYYIKRIVAGDTGSFACLLDRYSRPVHSLIFKMVRNKEDAEELAQDVFLKVFRNLPSFKADCSFSTWVYRIAYNTAISELRWKKLEFVAIEESQIENVSEEEIDRLLDRTSGNGQLDRLEKALAQLPPDERALILLFYWRQKTVEELTGITGLGASNVKVKLHRIRKKLFVLIKEMEDQE